MKHVMTDAKIRDLLMRASEIRPDTAGREDLGGLALPEIRDRLQQVQEELRVILDVYDEVDRQTVVNSIAEYADFLQTLTNMANMPAQLFATSREPLREAMESKWDALRKLWPSYAVVSLQKSKQATQADLALEINNFEGRFRKAQQENDIRLQASIDNLVEQAKEHAAAIVKDARETAGAFSIKAAQLQFDEESDSLHRLAVFWGLTSGCFIVVFVLLSYELYIHPPSSISSLQMSSTTSLAEIIYLAVIRITLLTAVGVVTAFCLRLFRAYLHMSAQNNHRRRIANSMAAFVEAAHTSEQRDLIMLKFIDAVVSFGDSGILERAGENVVFPSLPVELLSKTLQSK